MLKRVLVPLDGSLLAQMALDFATQMIGAHCEIVLLTAIQPPDVPIYGTSPMILSSPDYASVEVLQKDAERYLNSVAEAVREHGFQVRTKAEIGEPAQLIVQAASSLDVDMIIMSTHGRSGISRWLFGSVTGRVLGVAKCPVLVVPSQELQHKFEREAAEVTVS